MEVNQCCKDTAHQLNPSTDLGNRQTFRKNNICKGFKNNAKFA